MVENLPLARRELLDPRVALLEHEHVQAAGWRDPNMEPAISMRKLELATAEYGHGYGSVLDPQVALKQRARGRGRELDHALAGAEDDAACFVARSLLDGR